MDNEGRMLFAIVIMNQTAMQEQWIAYFIWLSLAFIFGYSAFKESMRKS